jgi:predicted O-methyltransferase YrrM
MQFIQHILKLSNREDIFITDFQKLIRKRNELAASQVDSYYANFLDDTQLLEYTSPGAGSKKNKKLPAISEYAKRTCVHPAKANILFQIAASYKPELIIELGTSLGYSTMYLAKGCPQSRIITVEGNPQIAALSEDSFRKHQFSRIRVIHAFFDDVLPELVKNTNSNTMVFIDGNHTYEATMKYINAFSEARLIVLDDIRWSYQMIKAWNEIMAKRGDVTIIDLFSMGIIIRTEIPRHYHLYL